MVNISILFVLKFLTLLLAIDTTADKDDFLMTKIKTDNTIFFHT